MSSPEDKTASIDQTDPRSTNHSLQSSMSSSTTMDEIFFDIKSFRDSKGLEDEQQFVINRPESAVVQLARTRSKANRTHKPGGDNIPAGNKLTLSSLRNEILDKHASVSTVNTAVFDEVIAAVEEFATPTSAKKSGSPVLNATHTTAGTATRSKADLEMKLLPPDPVLPARSASVSRRDQMSRNIPSPVIEEVSPLSKKSVSPESAISARDVSPVPRTVEKSRAASPEPASQSTSKNSSPVESMEHNHVRTDSRQHELSKSVPFKRVDTPIEDSPTIPQGPPPRNPVPISQDDKPPPVPEKDSKFIPISKFAAKNTMSRVEQAGVRPARSNRSATDSITGSPRLNQLKHYSPQIGGRIERSATIPMPQAQQQSRTSPQPNKSDFAHRMKAKTGGKKDVTTVAAVVQAAPTAEVSVARTVSLARKQSAKVLVPGPKLAARRAVDRKEGGGTDSGADAPNTVLPAASSPAIGGDSPHLQQEQSIPRVVEVQPKGISIPPNPLRSHPSPPSIVITDLPAVGSTAGTATPLTRPPQLAQPAPEDPDKSKAREKIKALKAKAREKIANDADEAEKRASHISTDNGGAGRDRDSKERQMIEKYKEKDKTKWEIFEKRSFSPIVMEEKRYGHKQGLSVGVVLDSM